MYITLKRIAQENQWVFNYSRRDFQNLLDVDEDKDKIFLFLDPIKTSTEFDDYGAAVATTNSGSFMLLKSSELDAGYEERYVDDIKPLIETQLKLIEQDLKCSSIAIQSWNTTEIINLFDYGYDGIVVNYSVLT